MLGRSHTVADRAQNDHARDAHDYAVDLFIDPWFDGEFDIDDAIIVAEKEYFYTTQNTTIDTVKEEINSPPRNVYGSPKGDLDFAVILLDDQEVMHFEFKETQEVEDERERNYDRTYSGEEQLERLTETFETMEETESSGWTYEGEVRYLDEEEPSRGHPGNYTRGYWFASEELEERARSSEAFQLLNDAVFDGKFFWDDEITGKNPYK